MSVVVLYYFQGEPGESLDMPNAFQISAAAGGNGRVTFGRFLEAFPKTAGVGTLHYRFRVEDPSHGYLWLDVKSPEETIPYSSQGIITCKVLKIDDSFAVKRYTRLKKKALMSRGEEGAAAAVLKHTVARSAPHNEEFEEQDDNDDEDEHAPSTHHQNTRSNDYRTNGGNSRQAASEAAAAKHPTSTSAPTADVDLLGVDGEDKPRPLHSIRKNNSDSSAARENAPSSLSPAAAAAGAAPPPPPAAEVADMFHFDAPPAKTASASSTRSTGVSIDEGSAAKGTNGLTREQLVAQREAVIDKKVKEALEFKQELDATQQKESLELDQAKAKHDAKLTVWATNNKEKRNMRTLLSTMHTVLWADNKWKAIGLGDVIQPSQVKLQYRKAMLVVHPDRCSHLDVETKFIAKRVFEAINEAYQEFLKKESPDS